MIQNDHSVRLDTSHFQANQHGPRNEPNPWQQEEDHKRFAVFSLRHLSFLRHAQWRCFRTAPLDFEEDRNFRKEFFFFLLLIFEFPPFSLNFFCLRGAGLLPSDESL